jgi:bacteriocin-like protein
MSDLRELTDAELDAVSGGTKPASRSTKRRDKAD